MLLVMGSSLMVHPVARIPEVMKADIRQILINREPLEHHTFNAELCGNCDAVAKVLAQTLGLDELLLVEGAKQIAVDGPEDAEGLGTKESFHGVSYLSVPPHR